MTKSGFDVHTLKTKRRERASVDGNHHGKATAAGMKIKRFGVATKKIITIELL
jgi:hypothetical protein